jgi:hypothetical protein
MLIKFKLSIEDYGKNSQKLPKILLVRVAAKPMASNPLTDKFENCQGWPKDCPKDVGQVPAAPEQFAEFRF